jgi:hypothetical protein
LTKYWKINIKIKEKETENLIREMIKLLISYKFLKSIYKIKETNEIHNSYESDMNLSGIKNDMKVKYQMFYVRLW